MYRAMMETTKASDQDVSICWILEIYLRWVTAAPNSVGTFRVCTQYLPTYPVLQRDCASDREANTTSE